jgi:hypothetical protein
MSSGRRPAPPRGLSRRSRDFWRAVDAEFVLAPPDFELLRGICTTMDRLDEVRSAISRDGVTVPGSKGQIRPHPLLAEERGLNVTLARLLRELDLDADPDPSPRPPALGRNR